MLAGLLGIGSYGKLMIYSTAIIGAGAAGLMAASFTPNPTIILDHGTQIGRKILISGGGRCNFSNRNLGPEYYLSQNPHFCRSALANFSTDDFLSILQREGIAWQERPGGQLFAENSEAIRNMLVRRAKRNGATFQLGIAIESVVPESDGFRITGSAGDLRCHNLILATGGLSFPNLGASPLGYRIAEQFSMAIVPPRPALVGLEGDDDFRRQFAGLAGLSHRVQVRLGDRTFRGDLLFAHFGLSGPVILRASLLWQKDSPLEIDFLPELAAADLPPDGLAQCLEAHLPRRLRSALIPDLPRLPSTPSRQDRLRIGELVHHFRFNPKDTAGFDRAEVTAGGIDTRHLSSKTFEFRDVPSLHAIGEVLDVTGQLGGYNLHWAWASAAAAGRAIAEKEGHQQTISPTLPR